jgi:serine/threonine protein kinase
MNAERWKQIDELFDAALEIPNERREDFLSEKCNGDDDLKREVLSLLDAQKATDGFMEHSAMNVMAKELAQNRTEVFSLVGKEFGTYKIEKPIGAGGMGEVYLAHDDKLNRKVALKILPAEFVADTERIKRFEREARMVSALNHPYIVTIYDVGTSDGVEYIATEFVEGETVRELINRGVDLKKTLSVISQTCEALAAAHKVGIIHRDIKPENIMIRPDGFVKVLDFGLAKLNPQADSIHVSLTNYTQKGLIIGTPAYMSPEQVSDDKVDHRTDLWSVGVVLYEMLTGKNPFKGESRQATFQKILAEEPPLVSELNPKLPAELDHVLSKALEKDADVSYQTASDLRADLKRVRREIDSSPSLKSASGTRRRAKKTQTRRNYFLPAFGVLALLLVGFGIWFFAFRSSQTSAVDWSKATNVQLTEQQGTEYFPSLSPDGKSFVYAADANGKFDIFIQRVGSKIANPLTQDSTVDNTQPAFSPDGERIAFRSEREPKGIYMMGLSGENLRPVADFGFHPSWSPDGREIVISTFGRDQPTVRANGEQFLSIINVETGAKRDLINTEASFPAWSPSGKRIAYWFYTAAFGRRDIATISPDGGEPVIIAKDFSVSNWNPVWSPDGKFLYFVSSKNGSVNFWRVRIDETSGASLSEPEPVVSPSKFSRHLNFSRDGKRMIYVQTNNQSNIQGAEFDSKAEKIVGEPFWITQGDREITRAELSPDGTRFVMRLIRRTQDDIVTVSRDGSDWRDVTNDAPFDRYVRWSPDGKQLVFTSDRNGGSEVWTCNPDGTNLRQITFLNNPEIAPGFPVWSPDGRRLCFTTRESQTYMLDLTKNWNEQTPQPIGFNENVTGFITWDWSPDGKRLGGIIYEGDARFIGFYSFETNRYEKIAEGVNVNSSWLPDSRRVVYGIGNKIFIADAETRKARELVSSPTEELRSPFVSRDGRLLYYAAHTSESDIWLLDVSNNQ